MTKEVVIVGAAGQGRMYIDIIERMAASGAEKFTVQGVYDDAPSEYDLTRLANRSIPYLGTIQKLIDTADSPSVVIGIGYPQPRKSVVERLRQRNFTYPTIVDPSATVGSDITLGAGVVIGAGAHLATATSIGDFVHIHRGAIIGHDVVIDDYAAINPGGIVAGNVTIGASALIGAGATILQGLEIGSEATVGAGAVVTKPVSSKTTVKGIPAR